MSTRVDPNLLIDLQDYGAVGAEKCVNCGTCTAMCPLTSDEHLFPRNMIRLAQVGAKEQLLASTDPWLCYYCGDCASTCPKEAEPGETMMALRRWLTAQYDSSGLSAKLYTSETAVIKTIVRIALIVLALFSGYHVITGFVNIKSDSVQLNSFAPVMLVWVLVLIHGGILFLRMISGVFKMGRHVLEPVTHGAKLPLRLYLETLPVYITAFVTQRRWRDCHGDSKEENHNHRRWFKHFLLVSGYVTMLVLILGFLWWFQTDAIYPLWHPQRWLGYYATIVLIYTSSEILIGRWRKTEQLHRFSQPTDWLFPAFILTGAVTGIFVHIFRYAGWAWATYLIYVVHVMAMVAMLDTEVGVGKWAHLFYRPLAMYLEAIKAKVREEQLVPDFVPTGTD